jgi:hypothetical protein
MESDPFLNNMLIFFNRIKADEMIQGAYNSEREFFENLQIELTDHLNNAVIYGVVERLVDESGFSREEVIDFLKKQLFNLTSF